MAENPSARPVITTTSPYAEFGNSPQSLCCGCYKQSARDVPVYLIVAEVILGMLVWTLIASTDYFRFSLFGWVMFVSVFCWILTLFLLIISLTNGKIRHKPLTTAVLVFNCCAAVVYMSAAIVEATLIGHGVKGHDKFWAASTFFAFLVSLSYAGSAFFSFKSWNGTDE